MRKTLLAFGVAATIVVGAAAAALGVTATMGNPAIDRTSYDTWWNTTHVDTNNPAPFDGTISTISYYAERVGAFRFVVVDPSSEVTWISEEITAATVGAHQYTAPEPVGVVAGSNLGVYTRNGGVVSFDYAADAEPAYFQEHMAGLPEVGETLTFLGSSGRYYSMNASVVAASPSICKSGGWENYGYPNQGQCIASVVADEHSGK